MARPSFRHADMQRCSHAASPQRVQGKSLQQTGFEALLTIPEGTPTTSLTDHAGGRSPHQHYETRLTL